MTRQVACQCGHEVAADDDSALEGEVARHIEGDHPDLSVSRDEIRSMVAAQASDAPGDA